MHGASPLRAVTVPLADRLILSPPWENSDFRLTIALFYFHGVELASVRMVIEFHSWQSKELASMVPNSMLLV